MKLAEGQKLVTKPKMKPHAHSPKPSELGSATNFVKKLYRMVSEEKDEVVGFLSDGQSFEVKDPKRLEAEVLPKYFRHSRFQSLVRQLNFYSFKKMSKV